MNVAMKAGFEGGLVVDYPNSKKAKKYFLCLFAGTNPGSGQKKVVVPQGLEGDDPNPKVGFETRRVARGTRGQRRKAAKETGKEWIIKKKEVRDPAIFVSSVP